MHGGGDRFLNIKQVVELTSLSAPSIHRYVRKGLFPRSLKIGPNRSAWSEASVQAWMKEKQETAEEMI